MDVLGSSGRDTLGHWQGGHWYTHIMRKVRVKEWERTSTLWCKGHGRVKPGSTRPPDPPPLWCCSLRDVGASEWAQCGAALGPLYCRRVSVIRGLAFVLKENVRGFGWGRWKGHTQGSWGERGETKTNRLGGNASSHFLRHWALPSCMDIMLPGGI